MKTDEDWTLVQRCQRGDEAAFNDLFQKYRRKIAGFARKYLGDEHHADDIVQEVFLQVYRKLANFRGDARFSTWLFRVTVNACKSKTQSLERQRRLHEEGVQARIRQRPMASPESELGKRELRDEIEKTLDSLSDEQRLLLLMKTVRKLSYVEIGRATNQSENQVRGKLYRARKAFRSHLGARQTAATAERLVA